MHVLAATFAIVIEIDKSESRLSLRRYKNQTDVEVIYEQRERVFHRDIQTRENNV